jgi:hypothetical protein
MRSRKKSRPTIRRKRMRESKKETKIEENYIMKAEQKEDNKRVRKR